MAAVRAVGCALALLLVDSANEIDLTDQWSDSTVLDPTSYVEPSDSEYWGKGASTLPYEEIRTNSASLTRETFDSWVADGKVFVVEDAGRDWPMSRWDCNYFRSDSTFREAEMNQQYAAGGGAAFVGFSSNWLANRASSGAKDPQAPQVAPYYWGIKDVQHQDAHRSPTWRASMLKKVQEHLRLPAFMHPQNLGSFNVTPEFWFAGGRAGAKAHMDSHVQATMSLQLAGTKRWRLGFMKPRQASWLAMQYQDGSVYEEEEPWAPIFNITLRPGEALFFPPGFIHETLNTDDSEGSCSASVTFQFSVPMATRLYRTFLPRIRRTADIHEAWPLIERWASLHGQVPRVGIPFSAAKDQASNEEGAGQRFTAVDQDGSKVLTLSELVAAFGEPESRSILDFHDINKDGEVSLQEFADTFAFWAGTVSDVVERTPKKFRKYQLEDLVGGFSLEDLPKATQKKLLKSARKKEAEASEEDDGPGYIMVGDKKVKAFKTKKGKQHFKNFKVTYTPSEATSTKDIEEL